MDRSAQHEHAERFLRLHDGPDVLVVGSVWDPGSAVVFEREGFEAIATSSSGVAFKPAAGRASSASNRAALSAMIAPERQASLRI